jgi:hypothetical protein
VADGLEVLPAIIAPKVGRVAVSASAQVERGDLLMVVS